MSINPAEPYSYRICVKSKLHATSEMENEYPSESFVALTFFSDVSIQSFVVNVECSSAESHKALPAENKWLVYVFLPGVPYAHADTHIRARARSRQAFPIPYCSWESLIASISHPESTVSKLFEPRGSSGASEKKGVRILSVAAM